jgi:hypothetical protein
MKTLRIFISSPGDVRPERVRALNVAQKLQTKYRNAINLEPILWEHEAMSAFASFQPQIIPPSKADLVICILWARIGMRLPEDYKRADGTVPTGTEWEFEDAYTAHQKRGTPDLYVYRKTAKLLIEVGNDQDVLEWHQQKKALDGFLDRWFKAPDGSFKAAFNTFETDEQFERMLTDHLERIIEGKIRSEDIVAREDQKLSWFEGSPFLGLRAFQPEHAAIFFGRDLDTRKILDRLKRQAGSGRVFLMVLGMSGCGKSSLIRAGVLPAIERRGETQWECWRHFVLRPSETAGTLMSVLAEGLLKAVPEISTSGYDADRLAALLSEAPIHVIPILQAALNHASRASAREQGLNTTAGGRLFFLIDQFEEVFTVDRFQKENGAFIAALAALSRSGLAWIVVTMRSDLYGPCTEMRTLMELKGDDGQYDLSPPGFSDLAQMIRLPARAAGLHYESEKDTGLKLDDVLLEEAWKSPESLPLLEFTLDELFKGRSADNVLTWKAYRDIGGMQGAIARSAEAEYERLSIEAKESLPWVFRRLVTFEHNHATARQTYFTDLSARPGAREVVQRFVAANLFVAAGNHGQSKNGAVVISLAHEALLESWPLLKNWVESQRENLKNHAAVTADTSRWIENNRERDYLYRSGLQLNRAKALFEGDFLSKEEEEFVCASLSSVARQELEDALTTGESLNEVSAKLRVSHPELRREILREACRSNIAATRVHAATLLGAEPNGELTHELVRLVLDDSEESVRRAAAASLIQIDHRPCFDELVQKADSGSNITRALGYIRAAADAVPQPTSFEQQFGDLKAKLRSKVISQSRYLRLRRDWPTLFIVLIPSLVISSIFAAVFKALPGAFNYAVCQSFATAAGAMFQAVIAVFFWGGIITFAITFHRVVIRSELSKKSYLQPASTLLAGAIGGFVSSALLVLTMVVVYEPAGLTNMGWTSQTWQTHGRDFWLELLWARRTLWPYMIMGIGLGIGMAAMTNGLWASREWSSFAGRQSVLSGSDVVPLVKKLTRLMVRFAWTIPLCMLAAGLLAFFVLRTAPAFSTHATAHPQSLSDALLGGIATHTSEQIRDWKNSPWGQGLAIFFDSATQGWGGFFCIVGMGLGLIAIRCGVKIEPRKN